MLNNQGTLNAASLRAAGSLLQAAEQDWARADRGPWQQGFSVCFAEEKTSLTEPTRALAVVMARAALE